MAKTMVMCVDGGAFISPVGREVRPLGPLGAVGPLPHASQLVKPTDRRQQLAEDRDVAREEQRVILQRGEQPQRAGGALYLGGGEDVAAQEAHAAQVARRQLGGQLLQQLAEGEPRRRHLHGMPGGDSLQSKAELISVFGKLTFENVFSSPQCFRETSNEGCWLDEYL